MQQFNNLYLIGSSHIARQSIDEIKKEFENVSPDIVAVELDRDRLYGLLTQKQSRFSFYDIRRVGVKGFLFAIIGGWASKKLGKLVGVSPGSEMKTAVLLAKKHKKKVALIDQPIQITLRKFSKRLSWKERGRLGKDLFDAFILRKKDPIMSFDLSKVPEKEVIEKMIGMVKKRYPNIYKVLIEERNYYMARKLKKLMQIDQKILAVVGAGHEEGILKILKENEGI